MSSPTSSTISHMHDHLSKSLEIIEAESHYCAHNYHPLPVVIDHGQGVWLYDVEGRKYLDMMSAYSAVSHGHSHPELVKVAQDQIAKLCITSRAFYTSKLGPFLAKICTLSGLDMALPMNTGAEAVETAIKASRLWGYEVKKIPEGKAEIIVATNNFHGRTTTIVGFASEEISRHHFGPFTPGFIQVPFGDIDAIKKAITPHTCAVLFEPMQGEAGIMIPDANFLKELRAICDQNRVLMILDEVQTGLGRTGKLFAFEHANIIPDGLILGKALGGGILPVSVFVGKKEILSLFTAGSHGSTFGGNPLAATIGLKALELIEELKLVENSAKMGHYFKEQILALDSPVITEIRAAGLWIGVDLDPAKITGRQFAERLLKKGILTKDTRKQTLRFAPPLIITKAEIDLAITAMAEVLKDI
jgi:ornithine--oxo-acid transaminase